MSKSTTKTNKKKSTKNVPVTFAKKYSKVKQAAENESKYAPSKESIAGSNMMDAGDGLVKLFTSSVKDLYWAENQLLLALPKMISAASSAQLQKALREHQALTETHVERLREIFEIFGRPPQAKKCDAMEGLIKEGEAVVETTDPDSPARDAGIIMACQKVEHYEISAYAGLVKLAEKLGLADISTILSTTLAEEEEADNVLCVLADSEIPTKE
jgi:ferritin-like metal-binding protein YciE